MKAATAGIFVAATLGSTVMLKGSTPPSHPPTHAAQAKQAPATADASQQVAGLSK